MVGQISAAGIRSERLEVNANEADNQQLTLKRNLAGPNLDKRLTVA
jgi:hypothetical protein